MYKTWIITVFTMAAVACADEPRVMTIDDLFSVRRVSEPQISPDGKQVCYTLATVDVDKNSISSSLWIAPSDGSSPPRPLTRTDKKDSHPRWSPDGRWILFQSNRSGSLQLWAIETGGGEAVQLTTIASDASTGTWSPDGRSIAFVSAVFPDFSTKPFAESNRLHQERVKAQDENPVKAKVASRLFFRHWDSYVDDKRQHLFVASFDPTTATLGDPANVTPGDRDANPTSMTFSTGADFCFSPDGTHLIFTAVPAENEAWNTNHDLCRVPVNGGSTNWERLGNAQAAEGNPVFSPDGTYMAFRAQSEPGFEADKWDVLVVRCDRSGRWVSAPVNLTSNLDRSADTIDWSKSAEGRQELSFTCQENGRVVRYVVGTDAKGIAVRPVKYSIDSISFARDGSNYVYAGSALDSPPEVYCGDRCISNANTKWHREVTWGSAESVTVAGADGVPMQMWVIKPPGFDPSKRWALGYLVHGGPQGAWLDAWSYRWNPQLWAAQGYVIALPNPRGSTGFGQEYCNQISRDWGGKCFQDLMKGIDWLVEQPYVDESRMFAAGASFGGYMMNWFQGHTDRFRTLVCHSGVFNFDSMYATTEELWFDEYEHGGPPWGDNRHSYDHHSPHRLAKNFKTPMLIIHSDLDFRVPVSEGIQLFTTLQRLGVPSRLVNFPDEGHWILKPANSRFWHEEVFRWLREYCPPGPKDADVR